jgi:hypothetical protein
MDAEEQLINPQHPAEKVILHRQQLLESLQMAIEEWMQEKSLDADWDYGHDGYVSDDIYELMAKAAFGVIEAQESLTRYFKAEHGLTQPPSAEGCTPYRIRRY